MVDQVASIAPDGTVTYEPRTPEELQAIENLVKSASGFDELRGDTITVESMQFMESPEAGTLVEISPFMQMIGENIVPIMKALALMGVAVGLMVFVIKPMLATALAARRAELEYQVQQERLQLEEQEREKLRLIQEEQERNSPIHRLRKVVSNKSDETTALLTAWLDEEDKTTTAATLTEEA